MKTLLRFFVLGVLIMTHVASTAQEMTFTELQQFVTSSNAQLPLPLGPSMELQSIELTEQQLIYRMSVNDIGNTIAKGAMNQTEMHKNMRVILGSMGDDVKRFFDNVAKLGLSFRMVFTSENTGDQTELTCSNSEISELVHSKASADETLRYQIESYRKNLPITVGNGITMTEASVTDDYLLWVCIIDETVINFEQFKSNKTQMVEYIENFIKQNTDLPTTLQATLCQNTGRGLQYIYQGSISKQEIKIVISCDRLKQLLETAE